VTVSDPSLLNHYMWSMAKAIKAFEDAEATYSRVVEEHVASFPGSRVIAEQRAATHPDVQQAIADGNWHRQRAQTWALGAIALMLHEQREKK